MEQGGDRSGRLVASLFALALGLRLFIAWADYGFVASDDHNDVLAAAVPAQRSGSASEVVGSSELRSPLPRLFIYGLARTAWAAGWIDPLNQIRFIYACLGILSMLSVWLAFRLHLALDQPQWAVQALVWSGLHFLAVFLSTRALLENMAAPFLTAAGVALVFYTRRGKLLWLLGSLLALTAASLFRFQSGVTLIVLLAVPLYRRAYRDLIWLGAAGMLLFGATGGIDWLLKGRFHASLADYLAHNLRYGSDYGTSSWYNYLLLLLGASLPPLLFARYRDFDWKSYLRLWPVIAMVAVFVVVHSLVPHKEDRFLVPILPLYLALLAPFSAHLFAHRRSLLRTSAFVMINAGLLLLIAAAPTQQNAIGLVRYLDAHPSIREVWTLGDGLKVFPVAYASAPPPELRRLKSLPGRGAGRVADCSIAFAVLEGFVSLEPIADAGFEEVAVFRPGLAEQLLVRANPRYNARRGAVHLFVPDGCAGTQG